jgi:integrase
MELATDRTGESPALPDVLENWWADYERSLRRRGGRGGRQRSQATIDAYRKAYLRFWRWALAHGTDPDPATVTHRIVNAWTDALSEQVSPATVAILWRNARPFFSWWRKEVDPDNPPANPFEHADVPGIPEVEIPVIDFDDIRKLLAACSGKGFEDRRDSAVIHVLVDCGVRLGELVNMRVGDWDRRSNVIYVNGKSGPRAVPHGDATGDALARYLRERAKHPKAGDEAMWLGRKGTWGLSAPQQMLARRCAEAGLPRLHPHQFRHTFSHQAQMNGVGLGDLMYLAGWKTVTMAQRYGASAAAERARSAYRSVSVADRL